jgi:hypothetical protein
MYKKNKVVRVNFAGGLLGLVFGSSRGKVEAVVQKHNLEGWNVAEVIADNPNLALILVRLILLIITLGLWTISSGYLFILEKPSEQSDPSRGSADNLGRIEPRLK